MNLSIKCAALHDASAIADVLCMSWQSAYKDIIPPAELARHTDTEARTKLLKRLISSGTDNFILAVDGEKPCGVCSFRSSRDVDMAGWGEIIAIYTIREYWGCGVGRALMDSAIANLSELGFYRVMLWTLEANARARRFYEKYGFSFDGTVKDSGICDLPEVRYRMEIK